MGQRCACLEHATDDPVLVIDAPVADVLLGTDEARRLPYPYRRAGTFPARQRKSTAYITPYSGNAIPHGAKYG